MCSGGGALLFRGRQIRERLGRGLRHAGTDGGVRGPAGVGLALSTAGGAVLRITELLDLDLVRGAAGAPGQVVARGGAQRCRGASTGAKADDDERCEEDRGEGTVHAPGV